MTESSIYTLSVLVVEVGGSDSGGVRDSLQGLQNFSLNLTTVTSVDQAESHLSNMRYDACFVESNSGPESSLEFVTRATRQFTDVPFILVSRKIDSKLQDSAFIAGAKDLISHDELSPGRLANSLRFVVNLKHNESKVRDQWDMVNGLLNDLGEVLWIYDQTREYYLEVGPGIEALTGHSASELLENPDLWRERIDPAYREARDELLTESETDSLSEMEYVLTDTSGEIHQVRERVRRMVNTNGSFWIVGVSRDITEEEHSRSRLSMYQQVMEETEDAILITDANLDAADGPAIIYVNPAFTRMTGYPSEEVVGKTPAILQGPKTSPQVLKDLSEALHNGRKYIGETINYKKDGSEYLVNWIISPIRDKNGEVEFYASLQSDVTEIRELQKEQARAQRLESMGNLVGGVAHDLNNILSPIMMGAEMLKDADKPADRHSISESILDCSERAAGVVGQLLKFARGGGHAREYQRLEEVMQEVFRIARETFPRHMDTHLYVDRNLWVCYANSNEIQQVVLNLAVNAKDCLSEMKEGNIRLSIENHTVSEQEARQIVNLTPGNYVRLQVTDDGPGMPPEVLDKIFDPFFTTKEEGKGTGLGLSSSLGIVKSHKGCLHVCSQPGEGTTFSVYLPADPNRYQEEKSEKQLFMHGNGQRILVVDDEHVITEMIVDMLKLYGYDSHGVTSGKEGLKLFAEEAERFDLVLTDIMMPKIDGVELVKRLRELRPELPVLAMSGYVRHEKIDSLEKMGVGKILSKPVKLEDLLLAVNESLQTAVPAGNS